MASLMYIFLKRKISSIYFTIKNVYNYYLNSKKSN